MPEPKFRLQPGVLRKTPPGGWIYRQMETQWLTPDAMSHDFNSTVDRIVRHRQANPQYKMNDDRATVALELEEFTAARILSESPSMVATWLQPMNQEAVEKKTRSQPVPAPPRRGLGAALAHAVNRLRRDVRGARILADWLGRGGQPVPPEKASARAAICATCPKNVAGYKLEAATAEAIRQHIEVKHQLELKTPHDDKLETCDICGCHLRLKAWVPFAKVKEDDDGLVFPDFCWVTKESVTRTPVALKRAAAFGDVIAASVIADHLWDSGLDPTIVCDAVPGQAILHHPRVKMQATGAAFDVNLDASYELSHEISNRHIYDLYWERATVQLQSKGIQLDPPPNRVPALHVTDIENATALHNMAKRDGRPAIAIIPRSAFWPNRTVPDSTWIKAAELLAGTADCYWAGNFKFPGYPLIDAKVHTFREAMAVMNNCDIVCTVDTGPMHAAAGLRKPILAILQAFRIDLRLTDQSDWQQAGSALDCLGCCKYHCPIDKAHPPCAAIPPETIAASLRQRLKVLDLSRVAAVIPTYRPNLKRLRKCVDAIRGQVSEIVVAVDGDVRLEFSDPLVHVVHNPTGLRTGFGRTMMRGVRSTNSGWVLMLNDDCYMDPGSIAKMLDCATPSTAVVGCLLRFPDGRIQHGGVTLLSDGITWGHRDFMKLRPSITTVTHEPGVTFASALVRRKTLFDLGGFDFRFDCYCEDSDFCKRLRDAGHSILFNPHATGIHEESQTSGPMKNALLKDGHAKLAKKWSSR